MGQSIKLSDDIVESVRHEAALLSRSVAGQAEHWLRIGQAIEQSSTFDYGRIKDALAGRFDPDNLSAEEGPLYSKMVLAAIDKTSQKEIEFFAGRRKKGLGVGEDEDGNLVHE